MLSATKEHAMKRIFICVLCAVVLAMPCIYDATSQEPSPLAGGLAVIVGQEAWPSIDQVANR
jgi:hypothetical protein